VIDKDPLARILFIDLSLRRYWVEERRELFEKYLGGAGVAIQLLKEKCEQGADPYGPKNPIVFAVGPLNGVFPIASKTVAMFKSPLTGNLGESHAGGRSAVSIRMAGYGAIVILGSSDMPIYLTVKDDYVNFRDASVLWGMGNSYSVGRVIREREPGAGIRTIMRIGRAGERLIPYASVITETYRHFGRLGLGAVFGSKKLKALLVSGNRMIKVRDSKNYRQVYNEIFTALTTSPLMKKYHDLGTPMNVNPLNEMKTLPTRNLQETCFEGAESISGETFARNHLGRRVACAHCPVSCIHLGALREAYEDDPYFYKTKMVSYDYELIYALGSMLGICSSTDLLKLFDEVEIHGLDAMSTGVALAWATETLAKGLISEKDTLGVVLKWGESKGYINAIRFIVNRSNEFYRAVGEGVEYASKKYGGSEFAMSFGGNEMPGYHTGAAALLGYLTGARHGHLDSAGYSIDQNAFKKGEQLSPKTTATLLIQEEEWRQILSSLVICFFARAIYTSETVINALDVMGWKLTREDLTNISQEILKAKYEFKLREGYDSSKIRIAKRALEIPTPLGLVTEEYLRRGMDAYIGQLGLSAGTSALNAKA
jgi:aldehyde:ferredoxin oxidoreductase